MTNLHAWSRCFFIAATLPFIILGTMHAVVTPLTPEERKGLSPRDPALRQAMSTETLLLTRRTTLWRTWVGFNFSHSLGAVLFGTTMILVARTRASYEAQAPVSLPFAVTVTAIYLLLGLRYWFRTPNTGLAVSMFFFAVAAVLFVV